MDYEVLTKLYEELEATTKRLEMTESLTNFIKMVDKKELGEMILLLLGRVFPEWSEQVIGVANNLMIKAISRASGLKESEITALWKKTGDLGLAAEQSIKVKKQRVLAYQKLTVNKVIKNIKSISSLEGKGAVDRKINLISELLTQASPKEARYITRTILGTLRVGVGSGTIRDAIARAFNLKKELVERAYNLLVDYSKVAEIAALNGDEGLRSVALSAGTPVKVMLYQKADNIEEGLERVGKPCAVEYKYDGLRLQVHKRGGEVMLYTRRFENVTKMFPEIAEAVKKAVKQDCVIEGEGVGYDPKTRQFKPFQELSKRIKRKYDVKKLSVETPAVLFLFDVFSIKGSSYLKKPFRERRKALEGIIKPIKWGVELANQLITSSPAEIRKFYDQALKDNQEGIMMKNLGAPYQPGSRVGYGIKIKPIMETLDLAITGAEWGQGRRAHWLSSFELSCIKEGKHLSIGKMGTGLSDDQFKEVTEKLKPLIISEKGKIVKVKPLIIVEVGYEEIQKSPTYTSGYALRFPRLIRFRPDKEEADGIERIKGLYKGQGKH